MSSANAHRENTATFFTHFSSLQRQIITIKLLILVYTAEKCSLILCFVDDDVVCLLLAFSKHTYVAIEGVYYDFDK